MKNNEYIHIEFKSLLDKFHAGNCTLEELKQLEEMFSDHTVSENIKNSMLEEIPGFDAKVAGEDADYDRLFKSIQKNISEQKGNSRIINLRMNLLRIAAILVLAFILGGTLSYLLFRSDSKANPTFCEITTPLGSTSEIVLPDNSHVWLNAGSKIRYSTSFNQNNRLLYLEGEGYFKVAKNKAIPFIVNAYGFEVKAVGTEFNIKAYNEDPTIETTMVEGKITLQHSKENILSGISLIANQKATFYKSQETLTVEVVKKIEKQKDEVNYMPEHRLVITPMLNPIPVVSWKENQLIIERKQLCELAEILKRKYNFNFEFKSEDIKRFSFSGTLEDETLQQVMDVIKISSPIDYEIVGKTVIIERNDKRTHKFEKLLKQQ
jgi:ferric-dicitrate binding protein FerR (iron transport regulator)